jgi:hypothetical protein
LPWPPPLVVDLHAIRLARRNRQFLPVLLNSLWRRAPRRLRAVAERHYLLGIWRSGGPPHPETSTNHHRVAAQICLLPGRAGDRCTALAVRG